MGDTQNKVIYATGASDFKWLAGFALFWNAIAFTAAGAATTDLLPALKRGEYGILAVYLFPAVGLLLIGWTVKSWLHQRRFGKTALMLDPCPGAIGGQAGGEIMIPVSLPPDTRYEISLQCLHSRETRNSKGQRSTSTSLEWQEQMEARAESSAQGVKVRFLFDVPADLPEPTPKSNDWHHWKLSISADIPGVDLDASFELPMHKSTDTSTVEIPGLARERQRTRTEQLQAILNADFQNDTLFFDFPYGRDKTSAVILLIAGAAFAGAGVAVAMAEAGKGGLGFGLVLFCGIFVLSGAGMLAGALYIPFNRLQVAMDANHVHVRRHWLGWQVTNARLPIAGLRGVKMERRSSVSSGKQYTVFYRVVVLDSAGKTWPVAESIPGRSLAEAAVRFLLSQSPLKGLEEISKKLR